MIARLAPAIPAVVLLAAAGCAGSGGSGSAPAPVSVAPPGSVAFAEGTILPTGGLKENTDAITEKVTGSHDLGEFILSKFEESSAQRRDPIDFEREVVPWLGPEAGFYAGRYDGERFSRAGLILQSTDREAAREFIDRQAESEDHPAKDSSYRGVEFKVGKDTAFGLLGELVVLADGAAAFRDAVDAFEGDSLSGEKRYDDAIAHAPDDRLADLYVDLPPILEQSHGAIDPQAIGLLGGAGVPPDATLVASLIPRSEDVEIDVTGNFPSGGAPSGDASKALESMPADSVAAAGIPRFGAALETAVDGIERTGIRGELKPHELKGALDAAGIDIETIASSLGEAGVFVEGTGKSDAGGALVISAENPEQAQDTVSNLGLLLRRTRTPGVTAVGGPAAGLSIRGQDQLGGKPLVVVAEGAKIAIGLGLGPALKGLDPGTERLAESPSYREAVVALGKTPISAFVDGPGALRAGAAFIEPEDEDDFHKAEPYLEKITSVAIGVSAMGDLKTTTMIVSLE